MPSPDQICETGDIANEFTRMISRRLAEGASIGQVAAGIALGLTLTARQNENGQDLVNAIGACLTDGGQGGADA